MTCAQLAIFASKRGWHRQRPSFFGTKHRPGAIDFLRFFCGNKLMASLANFFWAPRSCGVAAHSRTHAHDRCRSDRRTIGQALCHRALESFVILSGCFGGLVSARLALAVGNRQLRTIDEPLCRRFARRRSGRRCPHKLLAHLANKVGDAADALLPTRLRDALMAIERRGNADKLDENYNASIAWPQQGRHKHKPWPRRCSGPFRSPV